LPAGLTLASDGEISGMTTPPSGASSPLTVSVTDSLGTEAQATLLLRVVPPGGLSFMTLDLPPAVLGAPYQAALAVESATHPPLVWSLAFGAAPPGLSLSSDGVLSGTPQTAGTFALNIEVDDAVGHAAIDQLVLTVSDHALKIVAGNGYPDVLTPGETVDFMYTVAGSPAPRFWLSSGLLPPGITFSPDGHMTGTVTEDSLGTWSFIVEAVDGTGSRGTSPQNLFVRDRPPAHGGCSSAPLGLWVGLAVLALSRRRKIG
jgi:hypothetical protein